jgi:hypothetical protein
MCMTKPKRVPGRILVLLLAILSGSCVESRYPVSDEKTSKVDERLIGAWKLENDSAIWTITESANRKNGMDLEISQNGDTSRMLLFTTTIKQKNYMSIKDLDEEGQKDRKEAYDIYQYRFLDDDTVEARGMEPNAIIKAIENKELGGQIETKEKPASKTRLETLGKAITEKTPIITSEPEQLAHYIEIQADECFSAKSESVLTWKRQK